MQDRHNRLRLDSILDDDDDLVCDGECAEEQCEIPDDFKILPDSQPVDVMAFLGIRRAEPLRVEKKGEWQAWD